MGDTRLVRYRRRNQVNSVGVALGEALVSPVAENVTLLFSIQISPTAQFLKSMYMENIVAFHTAVATYHEDISTR